MCLECIPIHFENVSQHLVQKRAYNNSDSDQSGQRCFWPQGSLLPDTKTDEREQVTSLFTP